MLEAKRKISGVICLSFFDKPKTGGHRRYEMLVKEVARRGYKIWWFTPRRREFEYFHNVYQLVLPTRDYDTITFYHQVRKKAREIELPENTLLIVFGETTLPAAWHLAKKYKSYISIGVRSNILLRHKILNDARGILSRMYNGLKFKVNLCIYNYIYRRSDHVVVQTPGAKKYFCISFKVSDDRVDVVPNQVPLTEVQKRDHAPIPEKLLFVGNATAIKGYDLLIRAGENYQLPSSLRLFTIAGVDERYTEEFRNKWASKNPHIDIQHAGYTDDVFNLMVQHDLLIIPSREDQFPNVILEALSVNLPAIGADIDGIRTILEYPELLFEPDDPSAIYERIVALSDKSEYQKVISLCQERKNSLSFDWGEHYIDKLKKRFTL